MRFTEFTARLQGRIVADGRFEGHCPAHEDNRSSLSVSEGDDGKILVNCFAGCETAEILRSMELSWSDLRGPWDSEESGNGSRRNHEHCYKYEDEDGNLLYEVVRKPPKKFVQRRETEHGTVWGLAAGEYVSRDGTTWVRKKSGDSESDDGDFSIRQFDEVKRVPYRLPEILEAVRNGEPVYVVEGEKDVHQLRDRGLTATCNPGGAGKWRREYASFFENAAMILLPDNDGPGRRHMEAVASTLVPVARSVKVVELPDLPEKGDVSDWLEMGGTVGALESLVADCGECQIDDGDGHEELSDGGGGTGAGPYVRMNDGFFRQRENDLQQLSNFTAEIVADVEVTDGMENERYYEILANVRGRDRRVRVRADEFSNMKWVGTELGPLAIIRAGYTVKDNLRAAIQMFSDNVEPRIVYKHLGWAEVDGGQAFIHAGGAISTRGAFSVEVDLDAQLGGFEFPDRMEDPKASVRASLTLLEVAPDRITVPLLAAAYRAPLGMNDLSVHLFGKTGVFKTELASLAQQHYGAGMNSRSLPGSWTSTANALEGLLARAKDVLVTIDDFAPGHGSTVHSAHQTADRVLRSAGNRAGRQRMTRDGRLRPPRHPQALVVSTGEDVPQGQSLRARMAILELKDGDVDVSKLTQMQDYGTDGLFAESMAGYIGFIAKKGHRACRADIEGLRDEILGAHQHSRITDMFANLLLGFERFVEYALYLGAVTEERAAELRGRGREALSEVAAAQALYQVSEDPASRFLELLSEVISSGRGHLAPRRESDEPEDSWGWSTHSYGNKRPAGDCLGWVDEEDIYLLPAVSLSAAQNIGHTAGSALTVSLATLTRRLDDAGYLASTDTKRRTKTVRRVIRGKRLEVLHLKAESLGIETRICGDEGEQLELEDTDIPI